jgi:hypothetical protein
MTEILNDEDLEVETLEEDVQESINTCSDQPSYSNATFTA